jgi:flagella basal body P-ring formation protein FlgA
MSAEQLTAAVKKVKERNAELAEKNPQVVVVYTKKNIAEGSVISDDDVEERTMGGAEMPVDALHNKSMAVLKKAKNNMIQNQPVCQHDIAPLVGN